MATKQQEEAQARHREAKFPQHPEGESVLDYFTRVYEASPDHTKDYAYQRAVAAGIDRLVDRIEKLTAKMGGG